MAEALYFEDTKRMAARRPPFSQRSATGAGLHQAVACTDVGALTYGVVVAACVVDAGHRGIGRDGLDG